MQDVLKGNIPFVKELAVECTSRSTILIGPAQFDRVDTFRVGDKAYVRAHTDLLPDDAGSLTFG